MTSPKLVRDLIPNIIHTNGQVPLIRTATLAEYHGLLANKLVEEAAEYHDSGDPEELADVLEVVYALAATQGVTPAEVEAMRVAKAAERGGFAARVVWMGNLTGTEVAVR